MLPAPIEDAIIAVPLAHAKEVVLSRLFQQRIQGHWRNKQTRVKFWVFSMLDGYKDHHRIAEILHIPEQAVREAIIQLALDHLITMEVRAKENTLMDVQLLNESFKQIKPHGMEFAERFYAQLFQKSRETLASNEVERLFARSDMKQQYGALLGALAFVVAGVLENRDVSADLADLGQRHRKYGVKEAHYQLVGEALIESLQAYFGPKWTPELQQTWLQAYTLVSTTMQQGKAA
jgi:hemoglobin-like flavoprotein